MKLFLAITISFFALAMYAVPSPASVDTINAAQHVQLETLER